MDIKLFDYDEMLSMALSMSLETAWDIVKNKDNHTNIEVYAAMNRIKENH